MEVLFDANTLVRHGVTRRKRGARSCKWIQNFTLAQRQDPPHELSEKRLRLQARMWGNFAFFLAAGC